MATLVYFLSKSSQLSTRFVGSWLDSEVKSTRIDALTVLAYPLFSWGSTSARRVAVSRLGEFHSQGHGPQWKRSATRFSASSPAEPYPSWCPRAGAGWCRCRQPSRSGRRAWCTASSSCSWGAPRSSRKPRAGASPTMACSGSSGSWATRWWEATTSSTPSGTTPAEDTSGNKKRTAARRRRWFQRSPCPDSP